jgi:hypothetical protein
VILDEEGLAVEGLYGKWRVERVCRRPGSPAVDVVVSYTSHADRSTVFHAYRREDGTAGWLPLNICSINLKSLIHRMADSTRHGAPLLAGCEIDQLLTLAVSEASHA